MTEQRTELDRIVEEITALVRKSDYEQLREYVKGLVVIGCMDSKMTTEIIEA